MVDRPASPIRELERENVMTKPNLMIVGRGRVGGSLAAAAEAAGIETAQEDGGRAVLLCVPDDAIHDARRTLRSITRAATRT